MLVQQQRNTNLITIIYGKETLKLEDVKQMLKNNVLIKMTDSIKEALALVVKGQRGDQRVGDSKRI